MKKFISILLAICFIMTSISAFAVSPDNITEQGEYDVNGGRLGGSGIAYYEEEIRRELKGSNIFLAYHPQYPEFLRASEYHFTPGEHSFNVSIGASIYFLSFSISCGPDSTYYTIPADYSRLSRPGLYGNRYEVTYRCGQYNYNTHTWVSISGTTTKLDYEVTEIRVCYA